VLDACAGGVAVSWVRRIMSPFESTSKPYGRYGPQEGGSDPLQHCQMERWYWERERTALGTTLHCLDVCAGAS